MNKKIFLYFFLFIFIFNSKISFGNTVFIDIDFVIKNCITDVGNPIVTRFELTHNGETLTANFNRHDIGDLYHAWLILSHLKHLKDSSPIICEIGGGFGGLIAKIKSNVKGAKIILLDLPEVNACQSYYLSQVFNDAIIFGYRDYLEKGISILDTDFDFLILPGWVAQQLPKNIVDVFVNIRSMMEMSKENLEFYFKAIPTGIASYFLYKYFSSRSAFIWWFDKTLLQLPITKDLVTKSCLANFSRTLSSLNSAGVPILEALTIAKKTLKNRN